MPVEDQVVDLTKDLQLSWLEKGCLASEILGVKQIEMMKNKGSMICAVVEIDNSDQTVSGPLIRKELLPTAYLRTKCPQLLIQFYEKKICLD